MVSPVRTLLSSDSISPSEAGDSFSAILHSQLTHHGLVKDSKLGLSNSGNADFSLILGRHLVSILAQLDLGLVLQSDVIID